ncbi:MAG: pilus assembly PilX N-terminal domain-containing protein [Phycisphaerales bacterium]|nr:MAG: pilus assembly PilX N-terminal domain-containing protein [Phycisphaerales bacterium]
MKPARKSVRTRRRGAALITSMIFVLIFSALAIGMVTLSGTNLQMADNQHKADCARACAESGLEIVRFWLDSVSIPGTTAPSQRFSAIADSLESNLTAGGITNITTCYVHPTITIPGVTLDSAEGKSFSAELTKLDADTLQLDVTGTYGQVSRTVRVNYELGERAQTVFDYGVATRGPLSLAGNIQLDGINIAVESDVYIESLESNLALSIIGNSQIAGDVKIVNPVATVDLQGGQAGIGGETGQAAIDNHVSFGAAETEFPEPNPSYFESYVTNVIDSTTDTSADATFENVRILAGTNPTFSGHVTLKGVVYIETPNVVNFTGTTDVTGIIVGDGNIEDNSGVNMINFAGDVVSQPVSDLPLEQEYAELRQETGTFLIAPGFSASFGGSFETISGAIVANGIQFYGNAGGTINGSVINYSDQDMTLTGNGDLYFNRSGTVEVPAGFIPEIVLNYDASSYSEVMQ